MKVTTGTTDVWEYYIGGERVFPCRCGELHRGQYAAEGWRHHNCFHEGDWLVLGPAKDGGSQIMCGECGFVAVARPLEIER